MKRSFGMGMAMAVMAWATLGVAPMAVAEAQVRITSNPEGARVSCDGAMQGAAPVLIRDLGVGPHLIVVQKAGFTEVRRTLDLMPGQTSALEVNLEPITGLVLIESTPTGAGIEIDGTSRGTAPVLLTDLPIGQYHLKASAANCPAREIEFRIEDRLPQKVVVALAYYSASMRISSKPPRAAVTVNGRLRGTTPCTVERLPDGDSRVTIALSGYRPYERDVSLQAGEEQTIEVALEPLPTSLSVVSAPPGARIVVDGRVRGQTPLVIDTITPGVHTVRAELAGCESQTRTVMVERAQATVQDIQLVRNTGTLGLMTDPSGVSVVVDGRAKGVTESTAPETPSQTLNVDLREGEHRLRLWKKGYHPVEKTIVIKGGETITVCESMKRRFIPNTVIRTKTTPPEVLTGILMKTQPNGDIELETNPGIFKTIRAGDVLAIEAPAADAEN